MQDRACVRVHVFLHLCLCSPQLLQDSGTPVLREPDLLQVMEGVERRGVKELSKEAEQALRLLLTQVNLCTHTYAHTDKIGDNHTTTGLQLPVDLSIPQMN